MRPLLPLLALPAALAAAPVELSGIHPHLAMFNDEGECGVGALAPWAGRLWAVTYAPHNPRGDHSNKLYSVTPALAQLAHPESVGGTPASRMIHPESNQLFIGPYAVDAAGTVRAIPHAAMFGRPTGTARHLTDPAGRVVYATMEEGFYEVDARSLAVSELWRDEQLAGGRKASLPGYHGKGFCSGQGVYVYANNGEHGPAAQQDPDTPSGALAEWNGSADAWTLVRRCQFTDVTGPGGIRGNPHPATDPLWSIGWDARSLVLAVRTPPAPPAGAGAPPPAWSFFRLPKPSRCYDGAHGWNTEWPRIREVGEHDLLMTMHGAFWRFPPTFSPACSAGIAPRSAFLKVVGDFCRWHDHVVLGCDDTARDGFLNRRRATAAIAPPQSQSNLWFVPPGRLDQLGPVVARGSVWADEDVPAATPSDPFLFAGFHHRALFLSHHTAEPATIRIEVDRLGDGTWSLLRQLTLPAQPPGPIPAATFLPFDPATHGAWIRLTASRPLTRASAVFTCRTQDQRPPAAAPLFDALAHPGQPLTGGILRARAQNRRTLSFAAVAHDGSDAGYYELDATLRLRRTDDPAAHEFTKRNAAMPAAVLTVDAASVLVTDDAGRRWRLPKGDPALDHHPLGSSRAIREAVTERDLLNAHGTFYELPADNAGGFAGIRPVATHNRLVHDFCSFRGLLVLSGVAANPPPGNPHVIPSDDAHTALWAGAIDDLWQLGKPRGTGGPWHHSPIAADTPSDPYLMTAYDRKALTLETDAPATVTAEVDPAGDGRWTIYQSFRVSPPAATTHDFPPAFSPCWIRFRSNTPCTATATLHYH